MLWRNGTQETGVIMFGFAYARISELTLAERAALRTHYCGLCHALRVEYQLPAALLTGRDGRFLALLVNAQMPDQIATHKTRCPATLGLRHRPIAGYGIGTSYAAAVTVLLLHEKLVDAIRDDASTIAAVGARMTSHHAARATAVMQKLGFPLEVLEELRRMQGASELRTRGQSLQAVTAPTAAAVALIFAHTAEVASRPENSAILAKIGNAVGRMVTLLDACHDFEADARKQQFNAIAATGNEGEPAHQITAASYQSLVHYLRQQLQITRSAVSSLSLPRYHNLIGNILTMGLYDSTEDALQVVKQHIVGALPEPSGICPKCGHAGHGYFCSHCGASLREPQPHT
jgi:hypothetical protein